MKNDELNWAILKLLQQNARLSNAEIGRKVGLSSPAVAERIKKMEDYGLIAGYRVDINHIQAGYQLKAFVTLKAFMGKLKPFLDQVKNYKEVRNSYRITGSENLVMEVVLSDQFHLEEFIDRLITYGEVRTSIVLSNVVENNPIEKNRWQSSMFKKRMQ